jgi:hypothetical protein
MAAVRIIWASPVSYLIERREMELLLAYFTPVERFWFDKLAVGNRLTWGVEYCILLLLLRRRFCGYDSLG